MPEESALTLDNLSVVAKGLFVEQICELGPETIRMVCRALDYAAAFES